MEQFSKKLACTRELKTAKKVKISLCTRHFFNFSVDKLITESRFQLEEEP